MQAKLNKGDTTLSTNIFILAHGHKEGRNIEKKTKQTATRLIIKKKHIH